VIENLQGWVPVAIVVLKAVALVALPLVVVGLIWSAVKRLAPDGFIAVPLIYTVARVVGVGLGLMLIYAHQDERNFDLHEIFVPDGPWNISFAEFLLVRVNPLNYGPVAFIDKLGEARDIPLIGLAALAALSLLAIGWAWKIWKPMPAARASLAVMIVVLTMACLTIYSVSLLFWLLFLFNSWTFLLFALVLQYYRNR
jgi:hypothetical protein